MAPNDGPSEGEKEAVGHLKRAEEDLRRAEHEVEEALHEVEGAKHRHPPDDVTVIVDGVPHHVRRGPWIVRDLKAALNIPAAKVLAQITPNGLVDLQDDAKIELHEGERFMTHARSGGSS